MSCKRVLILAFGLEEASCRFRFVQYLPYLRACGIHVDVADLAVQAPQRRRIFQQAASYDQVLLHRVLLRWPEYRFFRRHVKNYVFDFDDAIMMRDSSRRNLHSRQRLMRFRRMARGAQNVIAGNFYLGDWAKRFNPCVTVLPTSIELNDYRAPVSGKPVSEKQAAKQNDILTIGWIGTRSNLMYLQTIVPALTRVAQNAATQNALNVRLKIVADDFLDVPGMEVIKKPWRLADEVADVQSFEIGLMPLPDDAWTKGKCALKILQSFAAGVPVVCSPVGANRDVVQDGVSGYFAHDEDE